MDAASLTSLLPELENFLRRFDDCFVRKEQRASARVYVRGQLSDLRRKSIEPMALACDLPPRNLQQFLSLHVWDEAMLRDRVQQIVAREHAAPGSVQILDETYHAKKGDKTPGVQRQWCGTKGTTDNCVVTVHLAYGAGRFRTLLDSELFLPEQSWSDDRARCRAAGIPDEVVYRPKWRIALEMLDRARSNGVQADWLTFDAGYGMHSEFMCELDDRGVRYVGEVPAHLTGWTKPPPVMLKEHATRGSTGRPRSFPRVKVLPGRMHKPKRVDNLAAHSPVFVARPWTRFRLENESGDAAVWEVREGDVHLRRGGRHLGVPTWAHRLIVARNVLSGEVKHFISNAPPSVPLPELLRVAFTRWAVERCFRDAKQELGLSHFEVRNYRSLMRHMILTAVSFLFLSRALARRRGEKSAPDDLPASPDHGRADPRLVVSLA
ncbi:MAG: IS701 family transposase [Myxococcota bacterium]